MQDRPIGAGASCLSCSDRRQGHLRFFELPSAFVVLCHNCASRALALSPAPESGEDLLCRLGRERRLGQRRCFPSLLHVGDSRRWHSHADSGKGKERRHRVERRVGARDLFDATHLAEEVADDLALARPKVEEPGHDHDEVTCIHGRL